MGCDGAHPQSNFPESTRTLTKREPLPSKISNLLNMIEKKHGLSRMHGTLEQCFE